MKTKNSWLYRAGPISDALDKIWRPFFLLFLCLLVAKDILYFCYFLIQRQEEKTAKTTKDWLSSWSKNQAWKDGIAKLIDWRLTFVLAILVIFALAGQWKQVFGGPRPAAEIETLDWEAQSEKEIINEYLISPLREDLASASAWALIDDEGLEKLRVTAINMSEEERSNLTQQEMLNIALIFYYSGEMAAFEQWREWGRALDPGEMPWQK